MRNLIVGVAVFTVIEIITLVAWLARAMGRLAQLLPDAPARVAAAIILFVGLFLEHVVQGVVKGDQQRPGALGSLKRIGPYVTYAREKLGGLVAFTGVETVVWIGALLVQGALPGPRDASFSGFTFAFLAITLVVKHAIADNVFEGRRLLDFSRLLEGRNLAASAIEAVGGAVWFKDPRLGTIIFMGGTSFVEHYLLTKPRRA